MITEQNGQIIVDELIPMNEAKKDGIYLAYYAEDLNSTPDIVIWKKRDGKWGGDWFSINDGDSIGFLPLPEYKPKKADE